MKKLVLITAGVLITVAVLVVVLLMPGARVGPLPSPMPNEAMTITADLLRNTFSQPFQHGLGCSKVFQNNRSWLAIDPTRLNNAPVGMSSALSFLKGCHISVYYTLFPPSGQVLFVRNPSCYAENKAYYAIILATDNRLNPYQYQCIHFCNA
ncbi:MAG: hypothetical protein DDT32_00647 [Syntrophomonadaceae bacterium]|nr:hypothetical protein [Bacillota bacterium]MBT9146900.1 hypothetical protein [Bacillota bacterium]